MYLPTSFRCIVLFVENTASQSNTFSLLHCGITTSNLIKVAEAVKKVVCYTSCNVNLSLLKSNKWKLDHPCLFHFVVFPTLLNCLQGVVQLKIHSSYYIHTTKSVVAWSKSHNNNNNTFVTFVYLFYDLSTYTRYHLHSLTTKAWIIIWYVFLAFSHYLSTSATKCNM